MSENVPAWKKAGLKQIKSSKPSAKTAYDPLKEGLKRSAVIGATAKVTKPPKRQKIKRSERHKSAVEPDQLLYLRSYTESRETWKFSKQKQNWILKHLFDETIDDTYADALLNYVQGLQGSARDWAVTDAEEIVSRWNTFMGDSKANHVDDSGDKDRETPSVSSAEHQNQANESGAADGSEPLLGDAKVDAADESKSEARNMVPTELPKPAPSERIAKRARDILKRLTEKVVYLELLD